jgi:hypothetical protein
MVRFNTCCSFAATHRSGRAHARPDPSPSRALSLNLRSTFHRAAPLSQSLVYIGVSTAPSRMVVPLVFPVAQCSSQARFMPSVEPLRSRAVATITPVLIDRLRP